MLGGHLRHGSDMLQRLTDLLIQAPPTATISMLGGPTWSPAELLLRARGLGGALHRRGFDPARPVLLMVDDLADFLVCFWGTLLAGLTPAPLSPPRDGSEGERERTMRAARLLGGPVVVDRAWVEFVGSLFEGSVLDPGVGEGEDPLPEPVLTEAPALVQLSSGSTRAPRGVVLPQAAILANLRQLRARVPITDADRVLTWMPHTHDMGLIGCHLLPLLAGAPQIRMHPLDAMRDPRRWLQAAAEARATVLASTPFALQRATRALGRGGPRPDLSAVRLLAVGAEPIDPQVCRDFCAASGVAESAIYPMYGLAEATVGVAAPAQPGLRTVEFDGRELVLHGPPLDGIQVALREGGELWLAGPNVSPGYLGEPEASAEVFVDGWLRTGDLAAISEGELAIVGRLRDIVVVNGQNHHAHDLEALAEGVPGVRAAVAVSERRDGLEVPCMLVVLDPARPAVWALRAVAEAVQTRVGARPRVLPLERIPRTTSGKKRRAELARQLAAGALEEATGNTVGLALEALSAALGRPVTDPDQPLTELGAGSIQAMDALSRMEAALGLSLDAALLRRARTPRELARFIERTEYKQAVTLVTAHDEPIAILGAVCRLPGASSPAALVARVREGRTQIGPVPPGRLRDPGSWTGAFLSEIERFDAARFHLSEEEAGAMDPTQRLALTLADALLAPHREEREIGVFLGLSGSSWAEELLDHLDDPLPPAALPGALGSLAATRLSQHLDLRGPAMVVDTACSSALVAVAQAVGALRRGECRMAVVGGAHLNLRPTLWRLFQAAGALSKSGRCLPLSEEADGTVPGEGAVLLLLAPRSVALASGRPILGLIRGIAVNNDGASLGVMAPNPAGQAAVVARALALAAVAPGAVRFVEAHAAGTPIGDPVERGVLGRAYAHGPKIGTSKAIFGHTMAAAGAVGLLRLLGELGPGELGAVSSFGFGGTNAHAVVEGGAPLPDVEAPISPDLPRLGLGEARVDGLLHRVRRDPAGGVVWSPIPDGPRVDLRGGSYVITGGAGGIGRALARHLARRGARRLLLAGRRPLDAEIEALCARLGGLGTLARYEAVDLGDSAAADAFVARLGRVDGIFHLAGGMDAAALQAKARGAEALRRADAGFVLLFSSISACLPGMDRGIEDYAAANAALDRIAAVERARGRAWTALAFGPWADVGMAAELAEGYARAGIRPLRPAEGMAAVERALALAEAHLVVTPREGSVVTAQPAGDLLATIRALVAEAAGLALEEVGDDVPLPTLGIDSVEALALLKKLERAVGRTLPTTLVFEHDTPAALARALGEGVAREAVRTPEADSGVTSRYTDSIPLAASQQTFVVQRAFFPDMPGSVLLCVTVRGPEPTLDPDRLAEALRRVAARHPVLSAVIAEEAGRSVLICGRTPPELRLVDALDLDALANEPFDLARGPLERVVTDGRRLALCGHHSVLDAWSQKLVLEDLLQTFEALRGEGEEPTAPASTWAEAAALLARPPERGLDAWRARFADGVPPLILPWDAPVHAPNSGGGRFCSRAFDVNTTSALQALARESGLSLPSLVLAIYLELLARWSGQPDVVVRVAHARREARLPELDRVVGSFADSLPVRLTLTLDEPLLALAGRVAAALTEAQAGAEASSLALASLGEHSPSGPVGLTPAGFSFPLLPAPERIGALELLDVEGAVVAGFTRLALIAWVFRGRLHTSWCAAKSHLSDEKLGALARDYAALVDGLLARPQAPPRPRSWPLAEDPPPTLHGRILARCRLHPEREAAPRLSYGQLARRSAALAQRLEGERIAVLAAPSPEAVIGVLSVLRSGAAYVPLDPSWPDARIAAIAAKGRPSAVLCPPEHAARASALGLPVHLIGAEEASDGPDRPGALCWVMFTSGSTGQPKGVVVTHRAALAFHEWVSRVLAVSERDRFLYTASLGYGGAIRQIFSPLLHGAMTVPAPPDALKDPDLLVRFVREAGVTVYNAVPSLWAHLLDAAERCDSDPWERVRFVLIGGEAVPAALVRRWFARHHRPGGPRLFDLYGSTETLVNATFHEITRAPAADAVFTPIGRPRAGTDVWLLGEDGRPLPAGDRQGTGEIVVGGAIAEGYFEDPAQTAAAFQELSGLGRIYRTGDLARRDAAGDLVYVGRADTQVQIRGNRVELGEIEHTLLEHPALREAVVLYEEGWLSAVYVGAASPEELRPWLEARLPAPMIPNRLLPVERIPRNPAGKADRRAALALIRAPVAAPVAAEAPVGGALEALARVWAEVLELSALPAANADFFALGGDSLRAVAIADRLRAQHGLALRPLLLYQHRTLGELAAALGPALPAGGSPGDIGDSHNLLSNITSVTLDAGPFPLSPVQRGFFTAHRRRPERPPVWCASVPLRGPLDLQAFREAIDLLVTRHEQLRVIFRPTARGPLQEPVPVLPFALQYDDLSTLPDVLRERALAVRWEEEGEARLELDRWPLFRARLCRLAPDSHVLILVAHHITSDAWSFWLLAGELLEAHAALARGREPALPPPVQLRELLAGTRARPDDGFWASALADLQQEAAPEEPMQAAHLVLGWGVMDGLRSAARRSASTPYLLVLTALFQALQELDGREDRVIATAFSGREGPQHPSGRVVGALARGLPVRVRGMPDLEAVSRAFAAVAAHEDTDPAEIARAVGGADAVERLGRTFLSWLDPAALPLPSTSLQVDWRQARFRFAAPSTGTELMVGAMASDGLTLNLHGGAIVERVQAPLSRRLRALATPDAALVVYAPEGMPVPVSEPTLIERVDTPQGRTELILLPWSADALRAGPALEAAVARAVQASDAGVVALAGMLPALTGLCARALGRPGQVVTTGHAVTVAAMVRTIRRVLAETGRVWAELRVGVLGLGSIGQATLELALHLYGQPLEILRSDPRLGLQDDLYRADLILGATSGGATLDVGRLRPGTLVIDDSFPRAYDEAAARARMERTGDVLLRGGGLLDVGPLDRRSPFPEAAALRARYGARFLPGCHAEALLLASAPELGPTVGPVDLARALTVWEAVERAGWEAPGSGEVGATLHGTAGARRV